MGNNLRSCVGLVEPAEDKKHLLVARIKASKRVPVRVANIAPIRKGDMLSVARINTRINTHQHVDATQHPSKTER